MTEIYLDGMLATPTSGAAIKLTKENPYFTKTSTYTYDIELPLDAGDNRAIFGEICRMDVEKQSKSYAARMVVDNIEVLTGEAHILSVNEKSVKVQLLGAEAAYNYGNKMADAYVDVIDMGDWFWETWPDGSYHHIRRGRNNGVATWRNFPAGQRIAYASDVFARARYKGPEYGDETWSNYELITLLLGRSYNYIGENAWVAYPTYNTAASMRHNAIAYQETGVNTRTYSQFIRTYEGEVSGRTVTTEEAEPVRASFSIQPRIWKLAEVVARTTGFTLAKDDNALYTDSFFQRIFTPSVSTSALINQCMPHWTVNEWWTQIENTFGVVMCVDYASKTMTLKTRAQHYAEAPIVELANVVDEYDTEIDDETKTDISSNNVGYADFENGPEDLLSDEILSNAEYIDFATEQDMLNWEANNSDMAAYKGVIFRCGSGRQFIYTTDTIGESGMCEVNMFRPRIVKEDNDEVEIELRIVPARYTKTNCDLFALYASTPGAANTHRDIPDGTFEIRMAEVPGMDSPELDDDNADMMDIEAVIKGNEEASSTSTSSSDVLYMAMAITDRPSDAYNETVTLASGGTVTNIFYMPVATLRDQEMQELEGLVSNSLYSLSLIHIDGQNNLAAHTIVNSIKIDANVRHCIKFLADEIPDIGSIFLIRNKKFVCEKLEANIKADGLDRLITGYFYEYSD